MKDIFEKVKEANRLEDVIEECGVSLGGHGRYMRGARRGTGEHSLLVNTDRQYWFWNQHDVGGTVIDWVMFQKKMDIKAAVEWLAHRAGIGIPEWKPQTVEQRHAAQARGDALTVAASVFHRWLMEDEAALAYARSRGFTDETIAGGEDQQGAILGYSGQRQHTTDLKAKLRAAFELRGVDPDSPPAVAILGYSGNVKAWAEHWGLDVPEEWIRRGYIVGFVGRDLLVYPHMQYGKCTYLTGRGLHPGADGKKVHWNPPKELLGERQVYCNEAWAPRADKCAIVEGQACAVSLGQLGIPAIALCGVHLKDLPGVKATLLSHHKYLYLGLDADKVGTKAGWEIARQLGPETQMINWKCDPRFQSYLTADGEVHEVEDNNDLLRSMVQASTTPDEQHGTVLDILERSIPYWQMMVEWAGRTQGPERQDAIQEAVSVIIQIPPLKREMIRTELHKPLGMTWTQLKAVISETEKHERGEEQGPTGARVPDEFREIPGGYYHEHLMEMIYDPDAHTTALAVRYPDGHAEVVEYIDIDNVRYLPMAPSTPLIRESVVMFPSALVPPRKTLELVEVVRVFIHDFLDIDLYFEQLAAWYVPFTWMFDAFRQVPYLRALGDYGTGKSRMIETIGHLCFRPILTAGATSTSSIFRMLDAYRGTMILDEADFGKSDEAADIIKILNVGNRAGGNVLRSVDAGGGNYQPVPFNVYGPKIIATRKKFGDQATESRCLTYETGNREVREDVPVVLPLSFYARARGIRNLLLAYRFATWEPQMDVDYNLVNREIEPRLNQVTMALKTLIKDRAIEESLDQLMMQFNQRLIVERSQTMEAKILEAILQITGEQPTLEGFDLSYKNIASVTNEIVDEENDEDDDVEKKKLTNRGTGTYLRKLGMEVERKNHGYVMIWNERNQRRIKAMRKRYGV